MRIKKIGWIVLFLLLTISGRAQAFFDKLEAHKEITKEYEGIYYRKPTSRGFAKK